MNLFDKAWKCQKEGEYALAIQFFIKAYEEENDAIAAFNAAWVYEDFLNDEEQALKWYTLSANMGEYDAMYNIGKIHHNNKEFDKAVKWFKKASKGDVSQAFVDLGSVLETQEHLYEKAAKQYKKAYNLGNAKGAFHLGNLYRDTLVDEVKMIKWYKKAHKEGDSQAYVQIAKYYYDKKIAKKAVKYYKKSYKDYASIDAAKGLELVYETLLDDTKNAKKWNKRVSKLAKNMTF